MCPQVKCQIVSVSALEAGTETTARNVPVLWALHGPIRPQISPIPALIVPIVPIVVWVFIPSLTKNVPSRVQECVKFLPAIPVRWPVCPVQLHGICVDHFQVSPTVIAAYILARNHLLEENKVLFACWALSNVYHLSPQFLARFTLRIAYSGQVHTTTVSLSE